ncbi:hypothetical protein RRG08_010342 [Elysia crispata]|uniref:Transporter n=1 Tax=Elysia crispata TaxID=231223 RepID=A0AAE1AYU7_9GAST|nr:hypothetical protein RRG08_010342 [Elysia crispata]
MSDADDEEGGHLVQQHDGLPPLDGLDVEAIEYGPGGLSASQMVMAPGDPDRGNWGGKMEFIMTCVGYAVGLGNVWRFPYLCYKNGGGAFLVPYVIMLILVGLPLFFMELAFGQFASLGPITVWRINPLFKGLGYAMVIVSWLISLYYNVIIAQVVFYLFASFTDSLPWTTCNNSWNTNSCVPYDFNATVPTTAMSYLAGAANLTFNLTVPPEASDGLTTVQSVVQRGRTPAEEYYSEYVLQKSESIEEFGSLNWKLTGCLLVAWAIVGLALLKGVQSLGKVVYFTAIFPYLMLTVLLIRGLTLEGAGNGIIYYLKPDFKKLGDPRVWSDAATQIFYSLSACSGGLIAMSSFNKFTNNCHRDAIIVAVLNCSTSIFAGFVIFSILGFMANEKDEDVADVAKGGPGLAFEVYPEALSRMVVAPMWAVFFFIMMATLGFGSQFSIVECVMSALLDEFPVLSRTKASAMIFRIGVVVVGFLLGLPMVCHGGIFLLELVDYSVGGFPLLIVGMVECIAINWIYGFSKFWEDIQMMIGEKKRIYWKICWTIISPFVILVTIIVNAIFYKEPTYNGLPFPQWAKALGWLIVMFPVSSIILWFAYYYCKKGGFRLLRLRAMPLPHWGPALADDRKDRYSPDREPSTIGTLEYQVGDKIYRSHLDVHEVAKLLTGSRTSLNTPNGRLTPAGSTLTIGSRTSVVQVGSVKGLNTTGLNSGRNSGRNSARNSTHNSARNSAQNSANPTPAGSVWGSNTSF